MSTERLRLLILLVTDNAGSNVAAVLDRLRPAVLIQSDRAVLVTGDASDDRTFGKAPRERRTRFLPSLCFANSRTRVVAATRKSDRPTRFRRASRSSPSTGTTVATPPAWRSTLFAPLRRNVRALVMGAKTKQRATSDSRRVLLLFSALIVVTFATATPGNSLTSVGALIVAAVTTGVALLHPMSARAGYWQRPCEWVLVIFLVTAGLIQTGGLLARTFSDVASPLWLSLIVVYAILALTWAALLFRRLTGARWAFGLFLVVHAALTVAFLRSTPAHIDTQVYLHDGVDALFQGKNPYGMTVPNIYRSPWTELFYGPGVVVDGRVNAGFPYLPIPLIVAIPGFLLGDVRYSQLIAMVVTAMVLCRLASDRVGRVASVLGVASVSAIPMLTGAWTEPAIVALLGCVVLALKSRRAAFTALSLGLLLVSKQYFVVVIPTLGLIRQWLTRRVTLICLGVAAVVTLPFLLVDPEKFWKATTGIEHIPLRPDSISLLVSCVNTFGWPPPWTYGVLPLIGGGVTALVLAFHAPRTPPAFAAAVGLTLLVTILLSRQAFMNYYFLVSGTFLIAAVAWPTKPVLHEARERQSRLRSAARRGAGRVLHLAGPAGRAARLSG